MVTDHATCARCRTTEHLDLLDSKPSSGDENGDYDVLLCIVCYGPGWCPAGDDSDFAKSVAPTLRPYYLTYKRANPANDA